MINWTGFYIGGNAGVVLENASGTSNFIDNSNPQSNSFSRQGGYLAGAQIGYNWQFAPAWMVGVEGDWDWTNPGYNICRQTDSTVASVPCVPSPDGFETISSKTDWLATLRGRLGFTWGN